MPTFPSNRIVRESADGLTRMEFDFYAHVKPNSLLVVATLCSTATYTRASRRSKWRKPSRWASFDHASQSEKPMVPPDVHSEVLYHLSTNLSVSG